MDVRIDRLRLQVSGMSPDTAREFGRLVAERLGATLAAAELAGTGPASGPARFATLRVSVPGRPGAGPAGPGSPGSLGRLATSAAAEISRALAAAATR